MKNHYNVIIFNLLLSLDVFHWEKKRKGVVHDGHDAEKCPKML